ncbi:lysophospholipid acyltransferase family protein [Bizionia sediminis]|uniref:Lysophospholipid acyltransferase family protein n=1 Tax=Bizionia sediminis TaxID=1737064 RepID=A0ABW5KTA1_9FLAO
MQFLAYILIYPILWVISILPFRLLYAVSDGLFVLLYYLIGYRKKVVKANLKLAFPNKTDKELNQIRKKFYHHLCDMILESIKSMTISEAEMKKHFTFTNVALLQDLEKQKRSVALVCAHYGSWEWIFILQTYVNMTGYAIYKQLANTYFDKLVKRIRAKYNSHLITTKEAILTISAAHERGEITLCGFASDQSPKAEKAHHWKDFMGIKVPVHTGAEMLAKKLDMTVVFFGVKRIKRGYYETTFTTIAHNPNAFPNYSITDKFLELVEAQINEAPEYYLWTHKRWKHRNKVPAQFQ